MFIPLLKQGLLPSSSSRKWCWWSISLKFPHTPLPLRLRECIGSSAAYLGFTLEFRCKEAGACSRQKISFLSGQSFLWKLANGLRRMENLYSPNVGQKSVPEWKKHFVEILLERVPKRDRWALRRGYRRFAGSLMGKLYYKACDLRYRHGWGKTAFPRLTFSFVCFLSEVTHLSSLAYCGYDWALPCNSSCIIVGKTILKCICGVLFVCLYISS